MTVMTAPNDEAWMQEALVEADRALATRDVPIGALVVRSDGVVLARAYNRREADADPTAHAEILALREAARDRGHWRLHDCTLYVTLEPCAMCTGALVNARIARVVYAATDPKAGAVESLYQLGADPRLNHRFVSTGGVLREASQQRLRDFFRQLRAEGQK
jgi:tRNA(adenine34) deaminase